MSCNKHSIFSLYLDVIFFYFSLHTSVFLLTPVFCFYFSRFLYLLLYHLTRFHSFMVHMRINSTKCFVYMFISALLKWISLLGSIYTCAKWMFVWTECNMHLLAIPVSCLSIFLFSSVCNCGLTCALLG